MDRIFKWLALHPIFCIVISISICIFFGRHILDLKIDTSANGLIIDGSEESDFYNDVKAVFGDDVSMTILYKADDVFTQPILQSIEDLTLEAGQLDGVSRVVSLSTVSNLKGGDGYLNTDPLIPYVPNDSEAIALIKHDALTNGLNIGEVVNEDGSVAAIWLSIEARADDMLFNNRLVREVETLMERERQKLGGKVRLYQVGSPLVKTSILDYIERDTKFVTPISLLAVTIVLLFFFRSMTAVVLPVVTGVLSIVTSLGFMALAGYALNPVTIIIPSLLLVIGSTEDIHIISEYVYGIREKLDKQAAIIRMSMRCGLVIFLTALTTVAGFLTVVPNEIPILSEFAISAAFGITINFVLTVLMAPTIFHILKVPKSFKEPEPPFMNGLKDMLVALSARHRKYVFIFFSLVVDLSVFGGSKLFVDTNYLLFFRGDAPVRQAFRDMSQDLSGASVFYVVIDTGRKDGLYQPGVLNDIAKLSDYLDSKYDNVMSYDRMVRKSHQEMNEGQQIFFAIPDSEDLIAQYSLLMDPESLSRFVDLDFQKTCILVRSTLGGSRKLNAELPKIHNFIDTSLSHRLDARITGEVVLIGQASDTISREIIFSIFYMMIAIFVLISLLFLSVKAGLLTLLPNVLPILVNFGIMGFMGIPLSASTFPVAIIALGIAVDDTIHFMVRFSRELQNTTDNEIAIARTISHELRPVFSTSTALCLGYSALLFAEFGSIAQFGFLSAVTMLVALIGDLILTPTLLITNPLITSWDLFRMKIKSDKLKESLFFKGLTRGEIKRVALVGTVVEFKKGENLLEQGQTDEHHMYIILSGQAEVKVQNENGQSSRMTTLNEGSIVGEMSFLSGQDRTATVTALSGVDVIHVDAKMVEQISNRFPLLGVKVYKNISQILVQRLDQTTKNLTTRDLTTRDLTG
ncbi:MAG: MMPL family transporter [Gammaproteobacteria bacterium]|nr:MMPL family transporter [Gammaproteobacteria bacterium]